MMMNRAISESLLLLLLVALANADGLLLDPKTVEQKEPWSELPELQERALMGAEVSVVLMDKSLTTSIPSLLSLTTSHLPPSSCIVHCVF
jgi:hypothetical protein